MSATEASSPGDIASSIAAREKQFVFQNYGRYPLAIDRGKGTYVIDFEGRRYLDLLSGIGVNALGHGHPRIVKAVREQAARLLHCSNLYYHQYQGELAERLARLSGLERVFYCNSGAEAIEGAIKVVRAHGHRTSPEKYEIVALENSFHGRTIGALSLTGQPKYRAPFEPLMPGARFVPIRDTKALEAAVSERTAGIFIETIQGEGGVRPVCDRMLRKARELATRHGALLVFDEIQCGIGRTGNYFAYQAFAPAILPDVMVTAKPLGVGIPIGIIAATDAAASAIAPGMHGTTFGGGPLACRVSLELLDVLEELMPRIPVLGAQFREGFDKLARRHEFIADVRVRGLMIGVELRMPGKQFVSDALELGMLINCTHDTVIRLLPPFTISEKEVARALRIFGKMFAKGMDYWRTHQSAQPAT